MAVYFVSLLSSYRKTNNRNRVSIYASCKICNVTYGLKCLNKFYMEQKLRLFNLQLNIPSPLCTWITLIISHKMCKFLLDECHRRGSDYMGTYHTAGLSLHVQSIFMMLQ